MKKSSLLMAAGALATSLLVALPVQAGYSWNFSGNDPLDGADGNTKTFTGSGTPAPAPNVTASAWSNTGTGSTLQTAYLGAYSGGLGVTNRLESGTGDTHTADNAGYVDSVLFRFNNTVSLSNISVGYIASDSDLSILAFTGSGIPSLSGLTYSGATGSLLSAGWEVIGNYANVGSAGINVNASGKSSSYWLVAAYNSAYGSACINASGGSTTCSGGNDYVKISAISANLVTPPPPPVGVPEPATLLLFAAGAFGLIKTRKS